ncbi:hypothetical protein ACFX13_038314 [Malus domestica]
MSAKDPNARPIPSPKCLLLLLPGPGLPPFHRPRCQEPNSRGPPEQQLKEHQSQKHPHPQLPNGFWVFPTSSGDSLTEPTRIPVTHPQPGDAVERPVRQVGVVVVTGKFFVGGGQGDCGEMILLAPVVEGYDDSERPRAATSASVSGHFAESFWVVFLIK